MNQTKQLSANNLFESDNRTSTLSHEKAQDKPEVESQKTSNTVNVSNKSALSTVCNSEANMPSPIEQSKLTKRNSKRSVAANSNSLKQKQKKQQKLKVKKTSKANKDNTSLVNRLSRDNNSVNKNSNYESGDGTAVAGNISKETSSLASIRSVDSNSVNSDDLSFIDDSDFDSSKRQNPPSKSRKPNAKRRKKEKSKGNTKKRSCKMETSQELDELRESYNSICPYLEKDALISSEHEMDGASTGTSPLHLREVLKKNIGSKKKKGNKGGKLVKVKLSAKRVKQSGKKGKPRARKSLKSKSKKSQNYKNKSKPKVLKKSKKVGKK